MLKTGVFPTLFNASLVNRSPALAGRKAAGSRPAVWQVWTAAAFAVAAVFLLGSYLVSVNSYAASGYELKKMQKELALLTEANQKLSVRVSQVSSMVSVQSQVLGADFIPAGTPQFLQVNQFSRR